MNDAQPATEASVAEKLMQKILTGEPGAETELVERYQRGLYTVLLNESKDEVLAKDIAQEAWEIVLQNLRDNKLSDHKKLAAYIIQTAKYRLLMYYRKNSDRRYESDDQLAEFEDRRPSPEQAIYNTQQQTKIGHVLSRLKERDFMILREFYIKGTEKKALCVMLELSAEHFDRVAYRARQRFKKIWNAEYGSED